MSDLSYLVNPDPKRFEYRPGAETMKAVLTLGNGGYEQLQYKTVALPPLREGEVRLKVLAAGMNNTEINTRLGWYSSDIQSSTDNLITTQQAGSVESGGWNGSTPFPFIQGTDCCGEIVEISSSCPFKLGDRVLVRSCMRLNGFSSLEHIWMASDFDGAFAQYLNVPMSEVFKIESHWSDAELATLPCAYGTAENMLLRSKASEDDCVLVLGASGGVGSAAVQLANHRGAQVSAVVGRDKVSSAEILNAAHIYCRDEPLLEQVGSEAFDVIVDNVAGGHFSDMIKLLKRGGRYVSSGAIAGPMVSMDLRDVYLKDLQVIGCTGWDEPTFPNLVKYVESGHIIPLLDQSFPLEQIVKAQRQFAEKTHFGKFVLIPAH